MKWRKMMKALAVLFALTLGTIFSGPAKAGEISSLLTGTGTRLSLPGPESLYTAFVRDLPRALMASGMRGAMQQQPPKTPPKDINLTINVDKKEATRAWYLSPVWMAIGGLGLAVVIILIRHGRPRRWGVPRPSSEDEGGAESLPGVLSRAGINGLSSGGNEMSGIKILAIVLVVGGVLGLLYGSFSYTKETHQAKLGSLELSIKDKETVNIPVWAGVGAIGVGGALLLFASKKS
jgi:hypothetical protein